MAYSPQTVRFGTHFDSGNDTVTTPSDADTLIHVRGDSSGDPDYVAVAGMTDGDAVEGAAEYVPEELSVYIHAGWAYASGTKPRLRTKRGQAIALSTDIALEIIYPGSSIPVEDGENRAYFLSPVKGQSVDVSLLDSNGDVAATITLTCTDNPPADSKTDAYVTPGQECYVSIKANVTDLDGTTDVTKQPNGGWTGREQIFLNDVMTRVTALIS